MRAALLLSVALITAPAAVAQTNDQYQSGDATAETDIDIGFAHDAAGTAVASGNVVTVTADDADTFMLNDQRMDGDTSATTNANVDNAHDNVTISSAAVANGGTAQLRGSTVTIDSWTIANGDTSAATTFTGGHADNATTSASAAGNVAAVSAEYSDAEVLAVQDSNGATRATVNAQHGVVDGQLVSGAVASANNLTVSGYTTTLISRTRQNAFGEEVAASVNVHADHANNASGNANASANNITVDNQWGYTAGRVIQNASANVSADSQVTLDDHFHGFASSGAYGVGNQFMVSNVGSDTLVDSVQGNIGDVSANAGLSAAGGDMALASAAAYGNNVTGALCSQCDQNVPSLTANNEQTNSGDVSARARVTSANANTVAASATAIGNAATYSARGSGE